MAGLSPERLALLRAQLAARGLAAPRDTGIPRRADPGVAPLSFAQEGLYFLELYRPGTALYNDCMRLDVAGELDLQRLRSALDQLQRRHPALGTTFSLEGSGPLQRFVDRPRAPLRVLDLRSAQDVERAADQEEQREARAPFDLEQGPPWRLLLLRLEPLRWRLLCTMHHLVSDGASYGILFRELEELCSASQDQRPPARVEPSCSFGDYAAWERAQLRPSDEDELLAFWRRQLSGPLPPLEWSGCGSVPTLEGAWARLRLGAEDCSALRRLARQQRATTNQVLLATWLTLLSIHGGRGGCEEVRTGVASTARRRPELESLVGFFVRTLVLRLDLSGDPAFDELLAAVRSTTQEVQSHEALPFDRLARALRPASGAPLVQAYFSHMRDALRSPRLGSADTRWDFVPTGAARFELSLVLHESDDELRGYLEHDLGLVDRDHAARLVGDYCTLLATVTAHPSTPLSELRTLCAPGARPRRRPVLPLRHGRAGPVPPRRAQGD